MFWPEPLPQENPCFGLNSTNQKQAEAYFPWQREFWILSCDLHSYTNDCNIIFIKNPVSQGLCVLPYGVRRLEKARDKVSLMAVNVTEFAKPVAVR